MAEPWKRKEVIGDCTLYLGDCLEIMPALGKVDAVVACCDAVVYTDIHGKTANWEPETPAASGVDMGKPQGGNNSSVCQWANVTSATGGPLRDEPARDRAGIEANGHQAEIAGASGRAERSVYRRDAKHDLPQHGGKDALQQVRGNGSTRCASCGRGPHEQRGRKFGSPVQPLPFQSSQTGVVGFPEGWAILTDPPYGIGAAAQSFMGVKKRGNSKCAPRDYGDKRWDESPASMYWFSGKTPAVIWGGNFLELPATKRWLIWDKMNDGMALADCEIAWTNTDGAIRMFRHEWSGFRRGAEQGVSRQHPTQKPVALMEWCLGFLPDARTVLDPFMGSGTTLVACAKLGRKGIGIELDPDYFDIACRRVEEAYRQPDLFVERPPKAHQEALSFDGDVDG